MVASLATLTTPQDALDAVYTATRGLVYVGDVTVDAISWDVQYGVDQAVATCRFTVPLPRPDAIEGGAEVTIIGGHNDLVGTLFSGRIVAWDADMSLRGDTLAVTALGWLSLLNDLDLYELTFPGPITLSALFDALCARRGVPSYRADAATDPTGTITIEYGTNPQLNDGGKVIIQDNQTLLTALNNRTDIVGYRIYDTATTARLTRVSGAPNTDPVVTFSEGTHLMSARRRYDTGAIVNYPDVHGQTYEDTTGATVPIRAFPATVVSDPLIPVNSGVRKRRISSSLIETQQLADIVMAVEQEDRAAAQTRVRWEAVAVPGLNVGDVVELEAETPEASGTYWLMSMDISSSGNGLTATYEGWAGGGTTSPVGDNSTEYTIQTAPVHLGNETLSHYAVSAPSGTSETWNITIPERATAINIRGLHHGTNSQLINGVNTDLEVTKWQIWADDVPPGDYDDTGTDAPRPETSGNMPIVDEDLRLRKEYDPTAIDPATGQPIGYRNWAPFAVNLRSLDAGDYALRLKAGVKAGPDDFEVAQVVLEVFGIAEPAIVPGEDI